ncbi:hypothetical protein [Microbulbifer elongatus]|uniref:hypothetical protein n=1 Tax=Microbulbifer elongatus TaxID=86173 RepID=UPI001CFC49BD|nr:hypothetical protein [Microbulbifer elongatus]
MKNDSDAFGGGETVLYSPDMQLLGNVPPNYQLIKGHVASLLAQKVGPVSCAVGSRRWVGEV